MENEQQMSSHSPKAEAQTRFDAVIVGGGMVGAAAALGLAQKGWSVAVIEYQTPEFPVTEGVPDLRISAISHRSVELLMRLGVWSTIEATGRITPYKSLETWEDPNSLVSFTAASLQIEQLGFMAENRLLQSMVWQAFAQTSNITALAPERVVSLLQRENGDWRVTLASGKQIVTPLVIGADGAHSQVRQLTHIGTRGWQYSQSCMLVIVRLEEDAPEVTWQHFTPQGPRAFLPLFDKWACLEWYDDSQTIASLRQKSPEELKPLIKANFPARLPEFTVEKSGGFPITRMHAQHYVKEGVVLVGDAAHTINPLAGQGVNLGYRDVETLIEVLTQARDKGEEYHTLDVLKRYERRRYPENRLMQSVMDGYYYSLSKQVAPLILARNLGLRLAQKSGKLKTWALRYAIGLK